MFKILFCVIPRYLVRPCCFSFHCIHWFPNRNIQTILNPTVLSTIVLHPSLFVLFSFFLSFTFLRLHSSPSLSLFLALLFPFSLPSYYSYSFHFPLSPQLFFPPSPIPTIIFIPSTFLPLPSSSLPPSLFLTIICTPLPFSTLSLAILFLFYLPFYYLYSFSPLPFFVLFHVFLCLL